MKEIIIVPEDRINVIKNEKTKSLIEEKLKVHMTIRENDVEIDGEGLELYNAKNIIKAIGRGFSPERAFRLLDENELLEIINLEFSESKNRTIRARLIGTHGKTRYIMERDSGASISIYGNTVAIIGTYEQIQIAKKSIEMIIRGSKHSLVYRYLAENKL